MLNKKKILTKILTWLKIYKPTGDTGMALYSSDQTSQVGVDVPTSGTSMLGQFVFREQKTNHANFALETFKTAADNYYVQFMVRRILADGSWSSWNGFQIGVNTSGGKYVNFRDSAGTEAWQKALQLSDLFIRKTYQATYNAAASATTTLSAEKMGFSTPSGYVPIGFYDFYAGHGGVGFHSCSLTATGTSPAVRVRNFDTSARNNITCTIRVVYMRTAFLG